ncbi:hypothetical protein DFQ01_14036 [Paenibacillus cellulosilyticus]|uniref:Cytoskeletal protein CcmA (Bactofilin family) n=1 Tax=Paenibacillus cellulosilyticus TaxID=375489 RepID=A0A2V2YNH9_9BACL|nr:hypothetical protein [Paenibacillus cellulosilyticus]PWV90653.1 hypothetical protein DFQ01_14036 [Paenibacillus cellulosilyticus]QKS43925.1 hypothetical protein HUB94_05400 [Paenibacillus cellulosilyticus]
MNASYRGSARVVGNGSIAGGSYDTVRIVGDSEVLGPIECDTFSCMGNCKIKGHVHADKLFKVTGDVTVEGEWSGEELKLLGQLNVRGNVRGRIVKVTGNLEAQGSVEAEHLTIKGAITVDGLINAEHADIQLYGPCRVKEIGGRRIDIRRSSWMSVKNWIKSQMKTELTVSVIEGDDITLAYTKADIVRGNKVHIGKGCEIGRVEYRRSLHVARTAKTGVEVRL